MSEMDGAIQPRPDSPFERIRRTNSSGMDYWSARELAVVLGYTQYRNFEPVVAKARVSCVNSGQAEGDHFADVRKMVDIGSGAQRAITTTYLSRYACYLVIQNADPSKENVALGQTYFAVQTRKQELAEETTEGDRRILLRNEIKEHNKNLAAAAKAAGVIQPFDYAVFQNHGYRGLYGGLIQSDIHARKGLSDRQHILDHMGSTELAANLFRATQTEEKLRRDGVRGKDAANKVHYDVGRKVRKTIEELGGTMPEELPVAEGIRIVESRKRKELK